MNLSTQPNAESRQRSSSAGGHSRSPVLVIGGTRGTGLLIARLLHERGTAVRVLARDPERASTLFDGAVEIVRADLTKAETLPPAIEGARHIVFTAGCRSGHPVREPTVRATEYQGLLDTLASAQRCGFAGRFLYMTSSGVLTPSIETFLLNLWKGHTLAWRLRAERELRASGVDYTVIRTGVLLNRPGGRHRISVTQSPLPLSIRYRIARADVARIFAAALEHPDTSRTTFEAVWGPPGEPGAWDKLLDGLTPDGGSSAATV